MPKSAKKRRDKAADFSKAKLKLGKGKQLANNAIDTSFKARSIALPTQSIAVEKDDAAPTTRRKLTFDDLIAHIKHYSPGTRKDALLGLRELLEANPELIDPSLTILLNTCVRIIGDEDASVRKTLLAFLSWLLPRIPKENLIPHASLLILFTTSAQTHIFPEIRIDAIRFLDLFLDVVPDALIFGWTEGSGHGNRVLGGYLGILNAGTKFGETDGPVQATSTASVVLSPASKLIVLKSLANFLESALSSPAQQSTSTQSHTSSPTWYLVSSFTSPESYHSFENLLQPVLTSPNSLVSSRCWKEEVEPESNEEDFPQSFDSATAPLNSPWNLQEISDVAGQVNALNETETSTSGVAPFVAHLARTLQSTLISTFLDCAPAVFSPTSNPPGTELQLIAAMAKITRCLYSAIFQDASTSRFETAREDLQTLLGYMTTYFPFRPSTASNRDIKVEQSFQELNIIYCELISLLVLISHNRPVGKSRGKARAATTHKSDGTLSIQARRVSDYVIELLQGDPAAGSSQLGQPLSSDAYSALLPTIWSLLNQGSPNDFSTSDGIFLATLNHAIKTSSKSAVKSSTVEFIARIALLEMEPNYQGNFRPSKASKELKIFEEWLSHLPKVLWELSSGYLPGTEVILRFLLRLFQRKSALVNEETITSIRSRMVPYFSITHATRGQLPGPYTKLPVAHPLRRLVLDLISTLARLCQGKVTDDGLMVAVSLVTAGTQEADYWVHLQSLFS